jgi:hypothetical protein
MTFAEAKHADAGPTCSTNSMNKQGNRSKRPASHIQRGNSQETPCVCRACDSFFSASHIQRGNSEEIPCVCRACDSFFIQHKDAFIYFVTLDPEVGNRASKFKE